MITGTAALLEWEEGAAGTRAGNAGLSCPGQQLSPDPHCRNEPGGHGSHDYLE